MFDPVILLQFGGFATLGIVMTYAANKLFTAFKNGDFVSRPIYERSEARADLFAGQLDRNTETLRAHTAEHVALVKGVERLTAAIEKRRVAERPDAGKGS